MPLISTGRDPVSVGEGREKGCAFWMRVAGTQSDFVWVVMRWGVVEKLRNDIADWGDGMRTVDENRALIERAASTIFDYRGADPSIKSLDPDPNSVVKGGILVREADIDDAEAAIS